MLPPRRLPLPLVSPSEMASCLCLTRCSEKGNGIIMLDTRRLHGIITPGSGVLLTFDVKVYLGFSKG